MITADVVRSILKERAKRDRARAERENALALSSVMQDFLISSIDKLTSQLYEVSNGKPFKEDMFDLYISVSVLPCANGRFSNAGIGVILCMGSDYAANGPFVIICAGKPRGLAPRMRAQA